VLGDLDLGPFGPVLEALDALLIGAILDLRAEKGHTFPEDHTGGHSIGDPVAGLVQVRGRGQGHLLEGQAHYGVEFLIIEGVCIWDVFELGPDTHQDQMLVAVVDHVPFGGRRLFHEFGQGRALHINLIGDCLLLERGLTPALL
jgi:hypothetical protein